MKMFAILPAMAAAAAAMAETPFDGFVRTSSESAAVRLEARDWSLVAPRVATGTERFVSADGLVPSSWETAVLENGWHEVADSDGGDGIRDMLVLNPPSFRVEGGRLASNSTWTSNAIHWVRNRVVVPDGVTLTIREGTVVKFGERTGITVESGGTLNIAGKSAAKTVLTSFADDAFGGDSDFCETNAVYGTWSVDVRSGGTISESYSHIRYGTLAGQPAVSMPVTVTAQRSGGKARIPVTFSAAATHRVSLHWRAVDGTAKLGTDYTIGAGVATWASVSSTTAYFDIPLVSDGAEEGVREFSVELESLEEANPNPSRLRTTVVIVTGNPFPTPVWAESPLSDGIRLENRDPDPKPDPVPDTIRIACGRLASSAVWDSSVATNYVLNAVVVPDGVTLTVVTNALMFFAPNTGIKVEAGGALRVVGSADAPVLFTAADKGDYSLTVLTGGTFADSWAQFDKTTVSMHPTVSIPGGCEVSERNGRVQIPVSVSGTRTSAFRVMWRAMDGTATFGEDYTLSGGEIEWSGTSQGTKYISIPVPNDGVEEESETFVVELAGAQGANLGATTRCTVLIRDGTAALVPIATSAESDASAPVRLENREEGTLGKAVVCGTEWKSADGDARAEEWDTTAEEDGWKDLGGASVLVRNDPSIAVEGGRLSESAVWSDSATHLVRNWVVVPSGVSLTVTTNAVVKFCESTGIKVEAGGRLQLVGSLDENVYFTLASDDTLGGDSDMEEDREWAASNATYSVYALSGGTFTDLNAVFRGTTVSSFGTASVNAKTIVDGSAGVIRIPVFVTGSRTAQFSVDWETSDGHSGRLVWAKAADGTKYVDLPVADCAESFTLTLCESRGINISKTAFRTEVAVYRNDLDCGASAVSEASEAVRLENRAEGTLARALVFGTEYVSADGETRAMAWDSTKVPDGWRENGTLVRNDPSLAIEGGRLSESVAWSNDVTRLLRNWVVVPNGVTLRIEAGTVVKFCEKTGFKVEAGGKIIVAGTEDDPVVYTAAADDTIGGDSDLRDATPNDGDYGVNILSGGTYSDANCAVRYTTFSNLGTASVPATVLGAIPDRIVRIPVFISTDRTTKFCVDWRVVGRGVPAEPPAVVTNLSGRVVWSGKNDGIRYIALPLVAEALRDGFASFEIELYESQGINISTTARRCVVTVYADNRFPSVASAASEPSAAVRLENRDFEWSFGAPIVFGTEFVADDGGARAEAWDSTTVPDGWQENGILVRNDPSIAVEGGRLSASTTWGDDATHLVRNWVVVPSGVTLTVTAGAVVKFCDETGIKVEAGGRLVSSGTAASDVIFTSVNDDTAGGDTDLVDAEPIPDDYAVAVLSGGSFTDTYTQMRFGTSGTFGSASIPAKAAGKKDIGKVRIPVTISSSRTTPFAVDWIACGDAIGRVVLDAPNDGANVIGGRLEWTGSSQGTKYIDIPLDRMAGTIEDAHFTVELLTGLGINLNQSYKVCEVSLYDTLDALSGASNGYAASGWCDFAEMDSSAGVGPQFAMGEELLRYSTRWSDNGASSSISVVDATAGRAVLGAPQSRVLHEAVAPDEGYTTWNGADYEDGRYDLTHSIRDAEGRTVKVDSATFIVNRDVVMHGGRLTADETWAADKVHLVVDSVTVPSGVTLSIAPDAIVKFMPGTGIVVERGGLGLCRGAVLTHAYDDLIGGDTMFDGAETVPEDGAYLLSGDWEDDESTQYRYSMPLEVSGTLRGEIRWQGHKTYIVTDNLTLASGATLTIDAGAVVKFQSLKMLTVNSGATLIANGTRSSPVVFTSIKDDDFGGDTNGDGNSSVAQPGDWEEIRNNGGTIKFEHVQLRYGGYGQYTNQGDSIIRTTGGTTTLDGCTVEQSQFRLLYRSGGTVMAKNCMFMDARTGIDGGATLANCVIANCNTGVSSATVYNTILWECDSCGSGTFGNCIAYGKTPSVPSGVVFVDPRFENAENGDFRIKADSPCMDAGDGTVAPEKDFYNQPRQTIKGVTPVGSPAASGAYADIGIYEVQPRNVGADIDLEVKSVIAPESLTVGELVTVSWREANVGTADTDGKWYDKVELISSSGSVVLLGTVPVTGIPAGGEKTITDSSFRVPAIAEGSCLIRVTANCNRDIYEGSLTANNVGLSTDSMVSMSGIDFTDGDVAKVKLLSESQASYSMTGLPTRGGSLLIHSVSGESFGAYVSFGKMPTTYSSASAYTVLPNGDVLVSIPPYSGDVTAYLMLDSKSKIHNALLDVTVCEDYPAIYALSKESMPNAGSQSLTIYGVGLDEVESVSLAASDGTTIEGSSVRAANACELSASFPLTGAKTGAYRVVVTAKNGKTAESATTVSIIPHANAKAHLEISLDAPSAIRQNRWYEAVVTVRNTGDADAAVPIVVVNSDGMVFKDPDGSSELYQSVIHLLAVGPAENPLVLESGGQTSMHFSFKVEDNRSDRDIFYKILDPNEADWGSLISQGDMDHAAWTTYLEEYKAGYVDVSDFLDAVFAKALWISTSGYIPINALRLYDLVQSEKNSISHGVVTAVVLDRDTCQPLPGLLVDILTTDSASSIQMMTDVNGCFTAYGVPTGMLHFVEANSTLAAEPCVRLGSGLSETVLYRFEDEGEQEDDEIKEIADSYEYDFDPNSESRQRSNHQWW